MFASGEGRWLTPDPAGLGSVQFDNPQTWDRYAYVLGNPTGLTDPTGLGGNCFDPDTGLPLPCPDSTTVTVTGSTASLEQIFCQIGFGDCGQSQSSFPTNWPYLVAGPTIGPAGGSPRGGAGSSTQSCISYWLDQLVPSIPPQAEELISQAIANGISIAAFNAALDHALTAKNALGLVGLLYPQKSSVFRNLIGLSEDAGFVAESGIAGLFVATADVLNADIVTLVARIKGKCHPGF